MSNDGCGNTLVKGKVNAIFHLFPIQVAFLITDDQ